MMRAPRVSDERGIALAVAVFALVIIGALVAGTFFAGRLEQRGGRNSVYAAQAFEAAEAGIVAPIAPWNPAWNSMAVRDSIQLGTTQLGASASLVYQPTIVRVSDNNFLIRAEGRRVGADGEILAQRTLATLAKLWTTNVPIRAALVSRGDLRVGGTADIMGTNGNPPGWGITTASRQACPIDASSVPSAEVSGEIDQNGNPTMFPPPVENSDSLPESLFMAPFDELAALAEITFTSTGTTSLSPAPAVTGSPAVCRRTLNTNWGEPGTTVTQCMSHFPVIYAAGNLRLNNGRGQGILLVEGDLTLAGNFSFSGVIITRGAFDASHGTNNVFGAVLSNNALLEELAIAGTPQIQFSTCAVSRALQASGRARPFSQRAWVQLN